MSDDILARIDALLEEDWKMRVDRLFANPSLTDNETDDLYRWLEQEYSYHEVTTVLDAGWRQLPSGRWQELEDHELDGELDGEGPATFLSPFFSEQEEPGVGWDHLGDWITHQQSYFDYDSEQWMPGPPPPPDWDFDSEPDEPRDRITESMIDDAFAYLQANDRPIRHVETTQLSQLGRSFDFVIIDDEIVSVRRRDE